MIDRFREPRWGDPNHAHEWQKSPDSHLPSVTNGFHWDQFCACGAARCAETEYEPGDAEFSKWQNCFGGKYPSRKDAAHRR
jgi:hypothetical protein